MDAEQQEMILDFIAESQDMLDTVEPMLIGLGEEQEEEERLDSVNTTFRLFHTLKGGAGFLNLDTIKVVTHTAETLLQLYRKDPSIQDPECVDTLTKTTDLLREMMEAVETSFEDKGFESEAEIIIKELERNISKLNQDPITFAEPSPQPEPAMETPLENSAVLPPEEEMPVPQPEIQEVAPPEPAAEEVFDIAELLLTPEMMQSYIQEAMEQLEGAEGSLLVLEKLGNDGDSAEYIETAFRNIHTLKGNSGFLGLVQIEQMSHKTESILAEMKEGKLIQEDVIQVMLKVIDTLRHGIKSVAEKQQLELPGYDGILKQLVAIVEGKPIPVSESAGQELSPAPEPVQALPEPSPTVENPLPSPEKKVISSPPQPPTEAASHPVQSQTPPPSKPSKSSEEGAKKTAGTRMLKQPDIRVSIDKVDQLINLVGELVISEAMVAHNPDLEGLNLERFVKATRQLNKNVRDLQEVAMSMRMLPISGTFRKMIRVVHDVSKKVSKDVKLELVGEETEVDRTVVEQIADPLLHIIRNAVDHGIDTPEERAAANKPKTGLILLEAKHSGNEIWITISDDGRGLNRKKIMERAISKGLIEPDADPPDSDIWKMVFAPGFSTAEQVTDFSGRGVGMDVVKRNIEKLHGRIDVTSTPGSGSKFILRIPLTLAIVDGMLIRVGHSIYVIPIIGIRESLQPKTGSITTTTDGAEMIQIRDELIPVVRLHTLHQLDPDSTDLTEGIVIVVEDADQRISLFVDEVVGERQVVVKGLPKYFGDLPHLAGCTILGDGDISLILDVVSIIHA
ncbi:MAG: chemotaxis protein CheA [SAR324 cluster bacterium]|nr:chemotaxis protein CheA [SAR324 cluster bacterium]